ncbi:DUF2306 domain-containing protein [Neolewinella agarilytica]|uniref:Predicted membrane protein n=1 Tax=Neolewinella agarilytica TaxID=478744 RepID=A0A1H9MTC9_9BACT|nr:DUF2306 domain-containing protein [Neolewinella agarilytica]SER26729.1 Predicted membrane protein [Neolewinella agarilytica]
MLSSTEKIKRSLPENLLHYASVFLVTTVWASTLVFGVYILIFYALAYFNGNTAQWNSTLPGLYDPENPGSTAGIAIHFISGGIILMLGCLQLMEGVRKRYPLIHRVAGRVYVLASIFAALGGLTFIVLKGTIGGSVMNVGFAGYGLLMLLAAVQTIRYARQQQFDRHRAWALRLFALAIGSWLYRMDYGFYIGFGGREGHTEFFRGWFDYFMDFWFYLPNLVVAEIVIGQYDFFKRPAVRVIGAGAIFLAGCFLLFASYIFISDYWGPAIMNGLS